MAFNKKLRIGQIDLTDLSSSEIASAADIANVESNVTSFESTALANVDSIQDSVDSASTNIDTVQSNLTTFEGTIDTVQDNVTSETTIVDAYGTYANSTFATQTYVDNAVSGLVSASPTALDTLNEIAAAIDDDSDIDGTLRGYIDTVQDNVTTVISSLDTVQGNLDAFAATTNTSLTSGANTSITANGEALSNTTLFLAAGAGISLSVNSTSKTVSVDSSVSNITSQVLSVDGTANSFTLPKTASSNSSMMVVFYNGLALRPSEYEVSGTTLTINNTDPLISDSEFEVRYFDFFDLPGTTSGSSAWSFQGSSFGYVSGGYQTGVGSFTTIEKYPFSSDSSATDVGEITQSRYQSSGSSSDTSGYTAGGIAPGGVHTIDKFPFSSDSSAADVGELSVATNTLSSHSSQTDGYAAGGYPSYDTIDKFPFTSDSPATDIAELTIGTGYVSGTSSATHGYVSGGNTPTARANIEKFTFTSDAPATSVGSLAQGRYGHSGSSSDINGYHLGGGPVASNNIQKYPFASDTDAVISATLAYARSYGGTGTSSQTHGYGAGNGTIEKFSFTSDTNGVDIGELLTNLWGQAAQQI